MNSRPWSEIRARDVAEGRTNEARIAELTDKMLRQQRAAALAELRTTLGLTQEDVARALHVGPARVSELENGDICRSELNTLAAYVELLGGRVEVVATFGEERIRIA